MGTPFHNMTNTRLEIGTTPAGLPNLVENPSGALGAWFWVTPILNTNMTVVSGALKFTGTASAPSYFVSDFMAVTAGRYVAARFDTVGGTASHTVRVRFEWYDSSKNILSSSVQTAGIGVTVQTNYVAAIQAPASTAYVKIRFDLYNGTGTTNPASGAFYQLKNIMVTHAATNSFSTVRTNLITNPSFETNTTGWTAAYSGYSLARVSTAAATGSWSCSLTSSGTTTPVMAIQSGFINITGGKDYSLQARFRAVATGRQTYVNIDWYDATNYLGNSQTFGTDSTGAFTLLSVNATAPAGATRALITVGVMPLGGANFPNAEVHYIDGLMLEQTTATPPAYFDGSSTGGGSITYAWTGTANGSTSTQTNTSFAFVDPTNWQNILGPTHEINIVRKEMEPGTLTATILDAALDPAVATTIKPGVKVRLVTNTSGTWDNVFEGKTSRGTSAYILDKVHVGKVRTEITLTASDNITNAANKSETRGVGTIDNLPGIFEGQGIPWNCNGSGNQVSGFSPVSGKAGAKLLDQIGFTRDSVLAWCWVDRFNVFQCWDNALAPSTNLATFSDTGSGLSYTDIDVGYDTDSVINSVLVKFQRYSLGVGDTTEIPYGPYKSQSAIDANNGVVVQKEFTVQGLSESNATFQAFANSILAANATAQITCRSLRMPVRNAAEMAAATTIDLYGKVTVGFGTKFNGAVRVTTIKHTITTEKWFVDYEFDGLTRVAQPRQRSMGMLSFVGTPNADPVDGTWNTPTLGSSWVNAGGTERVVQFMRKNGVVYIEGRGKSGTLGAAAFVLPVGYRPSNTLRFASDGNNAYAQLAITASGQVIQALGSNVGFSFNCSFVAEQ